MSLLLALLAVSAAPVQTPDQALAGVNAALSRWQGSLDAADGTMRCKTETSSGDAEIDAVGCAALTTCVPKYREQLLASNDARTDPATRVRMAQAVRADITACLTGERDRLAVELAARRAQPLGGVGADM